MECERCGARACEEGLNFYDYCETCGKNLCDRCMEEGCCGVAPAGSGMAADDPGE